MSAIRLVAAMLGLCGLGLLVVGSAGAVPKPLPKYWSVARCERVMLEGRPLIRQVICVASGGPATCRWTSGHRARLYSEFTVFTRNRQRYVVGAGLQPGVVRSFTLVTRAAPASPGSCTTTAISTPAGRPTSSCTTAACSRPT